MTCYFKFFFDYSHIYAYFIDYFPKVFYKFLQIFSLNLQDNFYNVLCVILPIFYDFIRYLILCQVHYEFFEVELKKHILLQTFFSFDLSYTHIHQLHYLHHHHQNNFIPLHLHYMRILMTKQDIQASLREVCLSDFSGQFQLEVN